MPEKLEKKQFVFNSRFLKLSLTLKSRGEYDFGEYGFKHRTQ